MGLRRRSHALVALSTLALASSALAIAAPSPASAVVDPANVVIINEVYGGGGNVGSTTNRDFIELFNVERCRCRPRRLVGAVRIGEWRNVGGHTADRLDQGGRRAARRRGSRRQCRRPARAACRRVRRDRDERHEWQGRARQQHHGVDVRHGVCRRSTPVEDFVGYGAVNDSAGAPAPVLSNSTSDSRNAAHSNTANNSVDFTAGVPSPQKAAAPPPPPPPPPPAGVTPIAEIQGTGRRLPPRRSDRDDPRRGHGARTPSVGSAATTSRRPAPVASPT